MLNGGENGLLVLVHSDCGGGGAGRALAYHFFARIYYLELHQGAKKVSFTACHLGKLLLVTYYPKSLLSSSQKILMSSIDYSSSVI